MAGGRGGGADAGQVWGQVSTSIPPALPLGKCPQMRAPEPAQLVGHLSHSFLSRANTGVSWGWGGAGGGELGLGAGPREEAKRSGALDNQLPPTLSPPP